MDLNWFTVNCIAMLFIARQAVLAGGTPGTPLAAQFPGAATTRPAQPHISQNLVATTAC